MPQKSSGAVVIQGAGKRKRGGSKLQSQGKIGKLPIDVHGLIASFAGPEVRYRENANDSRKCDFETYRGYMEKHHPTVPRSEYSVRGLVGRRDEVEKNRTKLARKRLQVMLGKGAKVIRKKSK